MELNEINALIADKTATINYLHGQISSFQCIAETANSLIYECNDYLRQLQDIQTKIESKYLDIRTNEYGNYADQYERTIREWVSRERRIISYMQDKLGLAEVQKGVAQNNINHNQSTESILINERASLCQQKEKIERG